VLKNDQQLHQWLAAADVTLRTIVISQQSQTLGNRLDISFDNKDIVSFYLSSSFCPL